SAVALPTAPPAEALLAEVRAALANDLDTTTALAAIDRWAELASTAGGSDDSAPGLVRRLVDALLGVEL
ncbi:MAG: L-cysteine:1D-myo-inositol 2-amino-2-deoxy-alpha-D-glucopyranoside ligase, partial [Pseudonocardiales bacterium]|nr:L-cysteine:1D-myo-inositol 2-amino-2-deoxy-alpha-D-glucopyranoside ligase [Pseudonocardiales bacterium]